MRWSLLLAVMAAPITAAAAGNTLVPAGQSVAIGQTGMTLVPSGEWNRLGARPRKGGESWTIDGATLNELSIYPGVPDGGALFYDRRKRTQPLPRFSSTMLPADVPAFVGDSLRVALSTSLVSIDRVEPARLGGASGVRFAYSFTAGEDGLRMLGEGRAAIVAGKLYLITFEAPALHYFATGLPAASQAMDSARLPPG